MSHPTNIIHRRRQARNAIKDAQRGEAPLEEAAPAQAPKAKKSVWRRKKKS